MRRPLLIVLTVGGTIALAAIGAVARVILNQAADNITITFDPRAACLEMKGDLASTFEHCSAMIENPGTPPGDRAIAYRNRGLLYARSRNHQRAIADFTEALALAPRDVITLLARGEAYAETGSAQKALADMTTAITHQSDSVRAHIARGGLYVTYQQPALALADYDRAIAIEPRNVYAYFGRATANRLLKYFDRALADIDKAIELFPRHSYGHFERGRIHLEMERNAEAEADFSRAIDIDPRGKMSYWGRALAFEQLNQRELALRDLDMAVALDPRNPTFLRDRARLYTQLGRWRDAIGDLDQVLAQRAGDTQALMMRAQAYENVGDRENAILDHRTVLRFNPLYRDSQEALKRLGAQTGTGSGDGCRDLRLPAPDRLADCGRVAADPNATADQKAAALLARGKILMLMNDLPKALADFDQAIKLKPGIADAHTERGLVFMRRGDHAEALKSFDRALAIDPRSMTGARIFRSNSLIALGRYDAALAELDRAAAMSPNDPGVFHLRGLAFEKMGQRDRAIADYREALRRFPQFGDAQEGLKRLGAR